MKVGFLYGQERAFPLAVMERINTRAIDGITAEPISLGGTPANEPVPYKVIVDRISHEIYYYRAYCKKAWAEGSVVINNPFWWVADDKFFECVLAEKLGVATPKTVVLPGKSYPPGVVSDSLHNLKFPLPWEEIVAYTGLPAVLKPAVGGGAKNIHHVHSMEQLMHAFDASGDLLMILQESIRYDFYVRCWVIGREQVFLTRYDFRRLEWERYVDGYEGITPELHDRICEDCLTLNRALGYDMNTVEFAIRDGVPIAIDFLNTAPDCEPARIGHERFEWVVEALTNLVIDYARGERQPPVEPGWQAMLTSQPRAEPKPAKPKRARKPPVKSRATKLGDTA